MTIDTSGQTPQLEVTVASFRRHARHLVLPSLLLVAAAGAGAYYGGQAAPGWGAGWLGPLIAGAGSLVFLIAWAGWLARRCVVTTRRLVVQRGVLVRRRQEMLHTRGYGIEVSQSPLQQLFGSGDIRIDVGLEHPVVVEDVPRVKLFARALQELEESSDGIGATRRQRLSATQGDFSQL